MDKEKKYLSRFIKCAWCNNKAEFTVKERGVVVLYLCEACAREYYDVPKGMEI